MKRLVSVFTIATLLFVSPLFSQAEEEGIDTGMEETMTETAPSQEGEMEAAPGEGSVSEPEAGLTESGEAPATAESQPTTGEVVTGSKAKLWTDKNGVLFANAKIQFTLSATDELSDVDFIEYKINDGQFIKYSGSFTIQNEGPHTIVYRAVDKAGNKEVDKVFNVVIDNNSPEIRAYPAQSFIVRDGKNYTRTGNFFTFRVTDDYAGIKTVEYSLNSNELKTYNGEVIQLSTAGTQFIRYRASDNLGNRTGDNTMVIEVDAERPTVAIVPTAALVRVGQKVYAKKNTGFQVKGTDSGSGVDQVMVRIDGNTNWQSYTDVIYFDLEQEHKIEAKTVDAVGNESEVKTLTFIVDENPPKTRLQTETN